MYEFIYDILKYVLDLFESNGFGKLPDDIPISLKNLDQLEFIMKKFD